MPYSMPEFKEEWQTIIQTAEESLQSCLVDHLKNIEKEKQAAIEEVEATVSRLERDDITNQNLSGSFPRKGRE